MIVFYYTQLGFSSFYNQLYDNSKYHAILKDPQNNISEAWEIKISSKLIHRRGLKDISEALEKNYLAQKI